MGRTSAIDRKQRDAVFASFEDPVQFVKRYLVHDTWDMQEEVLRSVATNLRTAVKACHASSKTFAGAEAVLWWLARYDDGVAVTTAPTGRQVEKLMWGEIRKAIRTSRIKYPQPNLTAIKITESNYAFGMSTRSDAGASEGVRFHGLHAGHLLIVIDEAPGVATDIWKGIEGIRAGGIVHQLVLGNPVVPSGTFFECFHAKRSLWNTISISAFDTPNLKGLTPDTLLELSNEELMQDSVPYLVTRQWVKGRLIEWGEDSPMWQAKVLGEFPTEAEDSLVALSWLEESRTEPYRLTVEEERYKRYTAGIDVAGPGDNETVVLIRQGDDIIEIKTFTSPEPRGDVVAALAPYWGKLDWVCVDSIGIGWYFGQHLSDNGFPVWNVNVGETPYDKTRFANLKAELYWNLRLKFKERKIRGLADESTIAQLASLRYHYTPRGLTAIESKKDMSKRGIPSPDRAEALMVSYGASLGRPGIS